VSEEQQPPEKPTVQFEKVPAWAIALKESVDGGFKELKGDISLVANDVSLVKERVAIVEGRISQVEGRQDSNSMRAKQSTETDLAQAAELVKEREAREQLATKVDIIETKMVTKEDLQPNTDATMEMVKSVKGLWARNPKLEYALVALILAIIGTATTLVTKALQ
jgi:hypothetical protein